MAKRSKSLTQDNYLLQPGFIILAVNPTIISTVLGSCVSVCLYDKKRMMGGMTHFQLPRTRDRDNATARYGNVSTLTLIHMMIQDGSKLKYLEAQIFGGAHNTDISTHDVGSDNILVARKILGKKGIPIVSQDVGGRKGRKIVYNSQTNEIVVMKVDKLRKGDWYPYEDDR